MSNYAPMARWASSALSKRTIPKPRERPSRPFTTSEYTQLYSANKSFNSCQEADHGNCISIRLAIDVVFSVTHVADEQLGAWGTLPLRGGTGTWASAILCSRHLSTAQRLSVTLIPHG